MNWNRQYRPKQVKDLHLKVVRDYFTSLLKSGKFPQVFLFAGPKGTGKTSTARIIAATLNDPKNESPVTKIFFKKNPSAEGLAEPTTDTKLTQRIFAGSSYVVNELDAASNRGIDDVRALKERVNLPPQEGLITVYILDEVHMLTSEAFNALLKLLEEPPPHVVFILATTEIDKIPPTIVSRAQLIRFTRASSDEIKDALKNILKQEKLKFDEEVLDAVVTRAEGSFRDAVKLLEMIAQVGPITQENAAQVLQLSLRTHVGSLVEKLLAKDPIAVVKVFEELRQTQVDAKLLHTQLLTYLHEDLLRSFQVIKGEATLPTKSSQFLLKELSDPSLSAPSPIPLLLLELKFLELIDRSQKKPGAPIPSEPPPTLSKANSNSGASTARQAATVKTAANEPVADYFVEETITSVKKAPTILETSPTIGAGDGQAICQHWPELINKAIQQNFGLATLLKAARPLSGEQGKVTVSVYYKFHKEQLMQPKFRQMIDTLFTSVAGGHIALECVLAEEPHSAELKETPEAKNLAELAVSSLM
jgi:DNA polymerase-3 subunit gamma/tau